MGLCGRVLRLEFQRPAILGEGRLSIPFVFEREAQVKMRLRVIGLKPDGLALLLDLLADRHPETVVVLAGIYQTASVRFPPELGRMPATLLPAGSARQRTDSI